MALVRVTGPDKDPVTIGEARAHCRIDEPIEDGLLAGWIIAAREHVEGFIGRRLITQTWDYIRDRFPSCIEIETGPVQSVTSISYVDPAGAPQTLPGADYQVDTSSAIARIIPAYQKLWPVVRTQLNAVTVRVVVGYGNNPGDVPEPIRQAMRLLVGHWYENRETVIVGTISSELPISAKALLWPYRVFY